MNHYRRQFFLVRLIRAFYWRRILDRICWILMIIALIYILGFIILSPFTIKLAKEIIQ